MTDIPRCGDHVIHLPSGETWVVAWADETHLAWAGWPDGRALTADCVIKHRVTDGQHLAAVEEWRSASDSSRRRMVEKLYRARPVGGDRHG